MRKKLLSDKPVFKHKTNVIRIGFVFGFACLGTYLLLASQAAPPVVLTNYIDPTFQTNIPNGGRSHWLQPWRAYSDTFPVSRLRNGLGIQFHFEQSLEAEATARLLAANHFTSTRYEIGWNKLSYTTPRAIESNKIRPELEAIANHGLRPVMVVNSNHGNPTPNEDITLTTTATASAGNQTVTLSPSSVSKVVVGKTGFNNLESGSDRAAGILITNLAGQTATLSKPLPATLPAGDYSATTLAFEPFGRPTLGNGNPNPRFEATMQGWLEYVAIVTTEAETVFGGNFDIEVWNELAFGSNFLNISNYYQTTPDGTTMNDSADIRNEILARTVAWVRDPSNGVPSGVGITNGFASTIANPSGFNSPLGLTALSKHPYPKQHTYPADAGELSGNAVNALGQTEQNEQFVPSYKSSFPENALSAIINLNGIQDITPLTIIGMNNQHGRSTAPPGGGPVEVWLTEIGLKPQDSEVAVVAQDRFKAKMAVRTLVSYIGKGVTKVQLSHFTAPGGNLGSIIDPDFFAAIDDAADYPGDDAGGLAISSLRRLIDSAEQGQATITTPRALTLSSITDFSERKQFNGDGTAAHPDLFDRDVLAFFPFQVSNDHFAVATYIMTRDMTKVYGSDPNSPLQDDLPATTYELKIGGFASCPVTVGLYDPVDDQTISLSNISCSNNEVTVQVPLTDSVRLLTFSPGNPADTTPPTTSITAPTNGATVTGTINITANASDDTAVTKVEFYIDGVLKSTDTTSAYSYSWNSTTSSNGSHSLTVKAYDAANNSTTSTAVAVSVSNPVYARGDLNQDGHVTLLDLSILLSHYGGSATAAQGDTNSDGVCNLLDLSILLTNYGT